MGSKLECKELEANNAEGWFTCRNGLKEWKYVDRTENKYRKLFSTPFRKFCKEVFLPQGFPESVHSDYVPYQIWDTVQAFASTILGILTTHSIMQGVGVGDSAATPLAAAITWILKDGTGMVGRILFAWWNGPELDAQCKQWRLFADVLNDLAMGIELCIPYFSSYATAVLCISSGMKSLVGVAGGATRAAITQHQALSNNLADVSAKDGSQETCVNLIASLFGIYMLSYMNVSSFLGVYYVILVAIHIYANYSAVRSLRFETFNENRLALLVSNYLLWGKIHTPEKINESESLKLFQEPSKELCGFDIVIGGSLDKVRIESKTLISHHQQLHRSADATRISEGFIIPDIKTRTIYVALENIATPSGIIDMYFKAFLHGIYLSMNRNLRPDLILDAKMTVGPLAELYYNTEEGRRSNLLPDKNIDDLINDIHRLWSELLDNSEWKREVNLLPIGPYRSYWKCCCSKQ